MPDLKSPQEFSRSLLKWFRCHARDLPWRHTKDPYKIWISEIMLQQTTVQTVMAYYERWIKKYPSVEKLASVGIQSVLKDWQGLGYYNRARNLHRAAQIIVNDYAAHLPDDPEKLGKLPGLGSYSTAAVSSIAFNRALPVVDANVRRVMMRVLNIQDQISTKHDKPIRGVLDKAISPQHPGDFNQAMMELGALICKPKEPVCNQCPVSNQCLAYEKNVQELIPTPTIKKIEKIKAVVGIIQVNGKILIQQRPEHGLLAGLWEFPGGKVEKTDKGLKQALRREILEELGLDVVVGKSVGRVTHFYTKYRVSLTAFICSFGNGAVVKLKDHVRFVSKSELKKYPMPSGSAKVIDVFLSEKSGFK